MTWLLPPDTYSTTGFSALVTTRPISMCPMQWLTPTSGTRHSCDSMRAATATLRSGAPMPGPLVKAMQDTWRHVSPACCSASSTRSTTCSWWCRAVSRGWKPVPGGVISVRRGLDSTAPVSSTSPTPILLALPSIPITTSRPDPLSIPASFDI